MAVICGSPYECSEKVPTPTFWCFECQNAAVMSADTRDAIELVQCPNLDVALQQRLAFHREALVVLMLQERTDLVPAVRVAAARHSDPAVYTAAAASTLTPAEELWKLHFKDEPDLLYVLAGNPSIGPKGLSNLARHPDPVIAQRARDTLMTLLHHQPAPQGLSASPFHRPPVAAARPHGA